MSSKQQLAVGYCASWKDIKLKWLKHNHDSGYQMKVSQNIVKPKARYFSVCFTAPKIGWKTSNGWMYGLSESSWQLPIWNNNSQFGYKPYLWHGRCKKEAQLPHARHIGCIQFTGNLWAHQYQRRECKTIHSNDKKGDRSIYQEGSSQFGCTFLKQWFNRSPDWAIYAHSLPFLGVFCWILLVATFVRVIHVAGTYRWNNSTDAMSVSLLQSIFGRMPALNFFYAILTHHTYRCHIWWQ